MKPDQWQKLEVLFEQASALPADQLDAFLEKACGTDYALRKELLTLLALAEEAPDYLSRVTENVIAPALVALMDEPSGKIEQSADALVGNRASHYDILEKLGEGGMGVVYKARDIKLERIVVLKLLSPHLDTDENANQRLTAEARAASALDHPNIGIIHEIGETEESRLFIAMAFYDGETLKKKIGKGPLPVDEVINLAKQIAKGLSAAHGKGIVHRDIKPSNVLITGEGVVKIIDFGIAKFMEDQMTKTSVPLGTVAYMSPEQTYGKAVDHRTDIWSLGVCLYEMLTGRRPFPNANAQAAIYTIRNDEPEPLHHLPPEVSSDLVSIISKCLAKDPVNRYQQVADLLADLNTIEKGQPEKLRRSSDRIWQNRYIIYSGLMVLLIAAVLFFWTQSWGPDVSTPSAAETEISPENRLAVLPFINYSQEPEDEYLADGLTEELISRLSRLGELRVIGRTTVMRYMNTDKRIMEIGTELQVGKILEGSVRKIEDRLRVTVQMVDAQTEEQIWSQEYETVFENVLAVQIEIAARVADELDLQIKAGEQRALVWKGTDSPEAYQLYLRGRYFWDKWQIDQGKKAIEHFEKAIEIDPDYAQAYAGLADAYILLGEYGVIPAEEAYSQAISWAEKALDLDENLSEAHAALARINMRYYWNWSEVENHFKRALELNPNSASTRDSYGEFLRWMGRFNEAIAEGQHALALDPLSFIINWDLAHTYYASHQYDRALEQFQKTVEMYPNLFLAHFGLGFVYMQKQMYDEAISEYEIARTLSGDFNDPVALQGYAYGLAGKKEKALENLRELQRRSKVQYVPAFFIGLIYTALDDKDNAFRYLEKAYEDRNWQMIILKVDPLVDPLRSDYRLSALLEKMLLN